MRTLNVGGSAGQPPRVFLTRMLGIRAAHLRPFSFSSSHQRPHPAPRTQSLSLSLFLSSSGLPVLSQSPSRLLVARSIGFS